MKCPNCNAEITNGKSCEYCGTQITTKMLKEQEQLNKSGCPICGSTNITFNREKQGEIKSKKGTEVIRSTVGLCKDCGYTWKTDENEQKTKRKTWIWILGWICIFPIPLTILILRKKNMKPALKYGIIVVAWIVYIAIGISGQSENKEATQPNHTESNINTELVNNYKNDTTIAYSKQSESVVKYLYDNEEIRDVLNKSLTNKIGKYFVIFANSSECTERALTDFYNYYNKNGIHYREKYTRG